MRKDSKVTAQSKNKTSVSRTSSALSQRLYVGGSLSVRLGDPYLGIPDPRADSKDYIHSNS